MRWRPAGSSNRHPSGSVDLLASLDRWVSPWSICFLFQLCLKGDAHQQEVGSALVAMQGEPRPAAADMGLRRVCPLFGPYSSDPVPSFILCETLEPFVLEHPCFAFLLYPSLMSLESYLRE